MIGKTASFLHMKAGKHLPGSHISKDMSHALLHVHVVFLLYIISEKQSR